MNALRAFGCGWSATARSKVALSILWLFYALTGLIVAGPAAAMALQPLAHSFMAGRLLEGFDPAWFAENLVPLTTAMAGLVPALVVAVIITWLGSILLAGGAITMLNERWNSFRFGPFLAAAGKLFWRLFRLSVVGLILYAVAFAISSCPGWIVAAVNKDGMEYWPMGVTGIVDSWVRVLLLGFMATVLDYAKVRLVCEEERGAVVAAARSIRFVVRHFATTMGVWLLNVITFALVTALYLWFSNTARTTAGAIALLIVVQQVYVLFRTAQRLAGWGAAIEVWQAFKPVPAVVVAAAPPVEVTAEGDLAEHAAEDGGVLPVAEEAPRAEAVEMPETAEPVAEHGEEPAAGHASEPAVERSPEQAPAAEPAEESASTGSEQRDGSGV